MKTDLLLFAEYLMLAAPKKRRTHLSFFPMLVFLPSLIFPREGWVSALVARRAHLLGKDL